MPADNLDDATKVEKPQKKDKPSGAYAPAYTSTGKLNLDRFLDLQKNHHAVIMQQAEYADLKLQIQVDATSIFGEALKIFEQPRGVKA